MDGSMSCPGTAARFAGGAPKSSSAGRFAGPGVENRRTRGLSHFLGKNIGVSVFLRQLSFRRLSFWSTRLNTADEQALCTGVSMLFCLCVYRCFWALWHGKASALVLQVLATQACGIKLAFSMCLLQCLHCTDEAHIGRNSVPCLQFDSSNLLICLQTWCAWLPNCWALCTGVAMFFSLRTKFIT